MQVARRRRGVAGAEVRGERVEQRTRAAAGFLQR
jgi:hypothetical protein